MYNGSFDLSNESKPIRDIAYDRLKHEIGRASCRERV